LCIFGRIGNKAPGKHKVGVGYGFWWRFQPLALLFQLAWNDAILQSEL
jgi:hypothetical protein